MITKVIIALASASLVGSIVFAQEHPEHPRGGAQLPPQGRTEHPSTEEKKVTKADISAGIRKYIDDETAKSNDKKLHVQYGGKDLALALIKVHDDRLSNLGGGKYFACVDMKATNSNTYDIDFFMAGSPANMRVTDASVHKVNGKPLYNWKEQNGIWKKVSPP
jgi:hypothetical protein